MFRLSVLRLIVEAYEGFHRSLKIKSNGQSSDFVYRPQKKCNFVDVRVLNSLKTTKLDFLLCKSPKPRLCSAKQC